MISTTMLTIFTLLVLLSVNVNSSGWFGRRCDGYLGQHHGWGYCHPCSKRWVNPHRINNVKCINAMSWFGTYCQNDQWCNGRLQCGSNSECTVFGQSCSNPNEPAQIAYHAAVGQTLRFGCRSNYWTGQNKITGLQSWNQWCRTNDYCAGRSICTFGRCQ